MAKNSYTLISSLKSEAELQSLFEEAKATVADCPSDIDYLFRIANKDRSLFPGINITGEQNEEQYLRHWHRV